MLTPRQGVGLVLIVVSLPMLLTGGVLTIFIGLEYSMTALAIGLALVIIGVVVMAIPGKPRPPSSPAIAAELRLLSGVTMPAAAGVAPPPRKVECPSCGASPSQVPPSGVVTCEYCEQTYVV